jgi:hypothetical protein
MSNGMTSAPNTLFAVFVTCLLAAFGCKPAPSAYDKLCSIYSTFESQPDDKLDWFAISQRIASEAPEISEDHNAVLLNQTGARYELLRKLAREDSNQPEWQCETLRKRWPPQ